MDVEDSKAGEATQPGGEKERLYTKDEVQRKLRGQGKRLAELEEQLKGYVDADAKRKAEDADRERKAMEEQGRFKELHEKAAAELAARDKRIADLEAREADRVKRVAAQVEEKLKTLPKEYAALVPAQLDADSQLDQIIKLEALAKQPIDVPGGPARRGSSQPENAVEAAAKKGKEFIFGKDKKR